jgi:hypothetical protein
MTADNIKTAAVTTVKKTNDCDNSGINEVIVILTASSMCIELAESCYFKAGGDLNLMLVKRYLVYLWLIAK